MDLISQILLKFWNKAFPEHQEAPSPEIIACGADSEPPQRPVGSQAVKHHHLLSHQKEHLSAKSEQKELSYSNNIKGNSLL